MRFSALAIPGAFAIDVEPRVDERGHFARAWCRREAAAHGIAVDFPQCNLSRNTRRGTLRGLHFSVPPAAEAKVVRCTRGAIFDVLLDLRRGSPAFGTWVSIELSAVDQRMVFIPEGVAHGFQTLADDSDVFYQMSVEYSADCARGLRWDTPAAGVRWPIAEPIVSQRDQALPARIEPYG